MRKKRLPESTLVGRDSREKKLALMLSEILGDSPGFTHRMTPCGEAHTCFMLYAKSTGAPHLDLADAHAAANYLTAASVSAIPRGPYKHGAAKGWRISRATYHDHPAAVIHAEWIS